MRKLLIILLSGYFLVGAIILPQSDFTLLSSLPKIYNDFISLNGKTSFEKFLDDQFIENFEFIDKIEEHENHQENEKEEKQVPINCYLAQQTFFLEIKHVVVDFLIPTPVIKYIPFYQVLYFFINPNSIFHPPKSIV